MTTNDTDAAAAATPASPDPATLDAVRLERRVKHNRMRDHLKWLATSRFGNKQSKLAEAMGVTNEKVATPTAENCNVWKRLQQEPRTRSLNGDPVWVMI